MELSSLTAATSSSSARNTDARSSASSNSANAPFADIMQRTANAEKPQRSGASSENPAPRSSTTSTSGASPQPDASQAGEKTTAPSSADVATSRTTRESRQAQGGSQGSDPASTDAQQILQSLETGDMAGLHAALEKLAGGKQSGNTASDTAAADDDSAAPDAQGLAALFAALPLNMTSAGSMPNGVGNTAGGSTATQAALQRTGLGATTGHAGELASIAQKVLAAASQQPGASTRVNAGSQAATGDASSDLDGKPGSLGNLVPGNLVPGNLAPGTGTSSGQPMPQGDLTAGDRLDATLASNRDFGNLNSGASPGDRPDPGSLASLTASLSNAAGANTAAASAAPAAITTAVQSPQWPASFGQQVLQMHQRGDQQMSLRLHPQDLGPLSVTLTVQDQQAQLQILSAHAPVRAAVEAAIPQLRQALADSGIALGEAMVGDQGLFQQNQFQDQSSGDDRRRGASVPGGSLLTAAPIDTGDESVLRQVDLRSNGNISLYA
ncbi:flagellar hook-length control protein FliK [Salinicola halophyticus]|uniref:flagellar hook-length control protein FliK n=1 Tax=Salinicola halophyticus TaxID=1808881 RepID=UPI003F45487B